LCFITRPVRFGLALGAVLWAGWNYAGPPGQTLLAERNFFGVARVTLGAGGVFRYLVYGGTLHGRQFVDPARQCEPLAYNHRSGPLGDLFRQYQGRPAAGNVAMIGLGTGSMIAYAQPGESWTIYEINPAVVALAQNTNCFTFLNRCAAAPYRVVPGDARLRLREAPAGHYGLIAVDAFNSDAIPVHLLTREAIRLYVGKLADGGLLVLHISNRYLDLEPLLAALARDAELAALGRDDAHLSQQELAEGKEASQWVVLARRTEDLGLLRDDPKWTALKEQPRLAPWTDDFSNLLGVFKWR